MSPHDVKPSNFTISKIIYTDDVNEHFSIAVGVWNDGQTNRFAMRWNGDETDPSIIGYPNVFGKPMWFQLPVDIAPILKAILENIETTAKL